MTAISITFAIALNAQRAIVINSIPENTPPNPVFYLGSSANAWNPGDENWIFEAIGDDYLLNVPETAPASFQGKVTRGDWGTVEGNASGGDIGNRTFNFSSSDTLFIQIAGWVGSGGGGDDLPPNLLVLDDAFYMPQLGRDRRIRVLLPLNYDSTSIDYPVLYMHDGQNLFSAAESFAGEWEVDEALANFESEGYTGCIIVAVDNGGQYRISEYTPWSNPEYGGGEGSQYIDFIVQTLKPYVDEHFRTLPDRANTGIMGSSLGGLISYYAGIKYPGIFSKVGVFSPSFWFTNDIYGFTEAQTHDVAQRFYFLAGGQESNTLDAEVDSMISTMENIGFQPEEIKYKFVPEGEHSEWFWAQEFPDAFEWLFINSTSGLTNDARKVDIAVFPNPATDSLRLLLPENVLPESVNFYDTTGRLALSLAYSDDGLNISTLSKGAYMVKIKGKDYSGTCRLLVE